MQNTTDSISESTVLVVERIIVGLCVNADSANALHILIVNNQSSNLIITGINTVIIDIITKTPIPDLSTPTLPCTVL